GGGAGAAVRRAGVRGGGAPDAQRRARLGPVPAGGAAAGDAAGGTVQPAADRPGVPAAAHARRSVLLERHPRGHQRAALGGGRAAFRRRPDRLPAVPDQPRGGALARPPARQVPEEGPPGPGDAAAVAVAEGLPPEPVAAPGAGPSGALG